MKPLFALAITAGFVLPYHKAPFPSFHAEMLTLALALLFVFVRSWRGLAELPVLSLVLAAFAAYVALRASTLAYWQPSGIAVAYILTAALVIWAAQGIEPRWVLGAVVVGATIAALFGFMQHFGLEVFGVRFVTDQYAMVGPLGQRNLFAGYMACGLVALFALRLHWSVTLALGALMMAALGYSGSRAAWLFLPVVGLVIPRDLRRLALGLALVFVVVRFFGDVGLTRPVDNLAEAISSRWLPIVLADRIIGDNLVFGSGWGEFAYQLYLHAKPGDPSFYDRHAHNLIVQIAAETGIVGILMLGGGMAVGLSGLRNTAWTVERLGVLGILLIVGIYSFTEFPLWFAQYLVLTAACLGVLPALTVKGSPTSPRVLSAAGLGLCVVVYLGFQPVQAFFDGERADLVSTGIFRPALDAAVGGMMTVRSPLSRAYMERALHAGPTHRLLCAYASTLQTLHESAIEVRQRDRILYGASAC